MAQTRAAQDSQRDWLKRMDQTEPRSGPAMRMLAVLTADAKRPDAPTGGPVCLHCAGLRLTGSCRCR